MPTRAPRKCISCGGVFLPQYDDQVKCPDCAAKSIKSTMRPRTCRQCGKVFDGGPRAWYCPDCRAERQREANRRQREKGTVRPLGSTDLCEVCGKPYIVKSARQRYCPDCAAEAVTAADNAQGRAYMEDYRKERIRHTDRFCKVCGAEIPPDSPEKYYCSDACRQKAKQESQRKTDSKRGITAAPPKFVPFPKIVEAHAVGYVLPPLLQADGPFEIVERYRNEDGETRFRARCKKCGRVIDRSQVYFYSSEVKSCGCERNLHIGAGKAISAAHAKIPHICMMCGEHFTGGARSKYCPACRKKHVAELSRDYFRRKAGWTEEEIRLGHRIK